MKRRRWSYVLRYGNGHIWSVTDLPVKWAIGRLVTTERLRDKKRTTSTVIERTESPPPFLAPD